MTSQMGLPIITSESEARPRRGLPLFREEPRAPGTLPAFSHYQPRVGHPDWPRLAKEAKDLATILLPTLSRPRSVFEDLPRRARSLADAAQSFIENRRRSSQGREDLLPLYFIWTMHRACNFLCSYCDDHQGHRYPELPDVGTLSTEDGKKLLKIMRTRATSVYFAGGEPTLRKDLPELTRTARDLDYYPLIVNTNASSIDRLLALPSYRNWLADMDVVIVSLDGLDLSYLAQTWGYERPEDVIRNLLLLRELSGPLGFKLGVNVVVQPGRIEHARDVLDLANDLGLWFTPVPMNTGPTVAAGLHDDLSYQAFARLVLTRKRAGHRISGSERLNQRLLFSEPLVCRNTLKPHIDADGHLFWPCKAALSAKPISARVLDFKDVDSLWAHCTERQDPRGFSSRCGAKCNWAQNYSTDAYAHGLEHPLSLATEVLELLRK